MSNVNRTCAAVAGLLACTLALPSPAAPPASAARVAGRGADVTYYLAADVDAGMAVRRYLDLQNLLQPDVSPELAEDARLGLTMEAIETRLEIEQLLKEERLVIVPYNTPVTTLEATQSIRYPLLPRHASAGSLIMEGPLTRVRVDDGPAKGRNLLAPVLAPREGVAAGYPAWILAAIARVTPAADSLDAARAFWKDVTAQGHRSSAVVSSPSYMHFIAHGTACTVIAIDEAGRFAQVRALHRGAWIEAWLPIQAISPDPPAVTP